MASRNIKLQAVESGYNRQHSTYIPADLGSGRGAGPPSLVDHHGQPILSDDLPLLHPLNRADPQDLGLEPDTVPRRCTDCIWIPPYFLGLALLVFVTQESMASAELWKLDSLPDLNGHLCGHVGSVNENKPFLFFCMDILSQFGPDSKNPRLDTYFPICVEECPDSWTTSHLCFQPGENGAIGTYAMVQDYPTIEFVGLMCRPSRSDHTTLFNQYRRFLESAPPIAMIQMLKRAWVTVMIAGLVSIAASYIFIAALGICAGLLVWSALMGVTLASFGFGIYMTWCYQQGGCGDPDSKYRDLGFGLLGFGVMFFFGTLILKLQHSLEVAIELIKASSSCVLQTPTLYLMPLLALLYRGIVAAWIAFVLLNFISAEMPLDPHLVYGDLETSGARLMWWNPWNMQLHLSYTHIAYVAFTGFMGIWTLGVISATSYFIITHGSMLWFFHDGLRGTGGAPFCAILRAYAVVFRYHLGSVISGGFFITLVAPVHGTLGVMAQMADDQENWLGVIFAGGRMGIVDYYNRSLRCITRDAFFDVSLQGMGFCEAASHSQKVTENEANMLSVLTGATWLFKLAGIGSATACSYYSVLFFICANPAHRDHKSDQYLPNPGLLCMVGLVVGCLVCLPFMQLFDVVSDSILFCKTVKHQRRRHRAGIIDRACASGMTNWFDEVAGCHCGSRPSQEGPSSSSWFLSGSRSSKKTTKNKQGDLTSQGLE